MRAVTPVRDPCCFRHCALQFGSMPEGGEELCTHTALGGMFHVQVGPGQACDPLPFFDDVISAGYPFEARRGVAFQNVAVLGFVSSRRTFCPPPQR